MMKHVEDMFIAKYNSYTNYFYGQIFTRGYVYTFLAFFLFVSCLSMARF